MSLTRPPAQPTPDTRPGTGGARSLDERIRERAYQIYMSRLREGVPGDPVTDWLRAEQELRRTR